MGVRLRPACNTPVGHSGARSHRRPGTSRPLRARMGGSRTQSRVALALSARVFAACRDMHAPIELTQPSRSEGRGDAAATMSERSERRRWQRQSRRPIVMETSSARPPSRSQRTARWCKPSTWRDACSVHQSRHCRVLAGVREEIGAHAPRRSEGGFESRSNAVTTLVPSQALPYPHGRWFAIPARNACEIPARSHYGLTPS